MIRRAEDLIRESSDEDQLSQDEQEFQLQPDSASSSDHSAEQSEHNSDSEHDSIEEDPLLNDDDLESRRLMFQASDPMLRQLEMQSNDSTTSHRLARALYGDVDRRQREHLSYQIMFSIFIDFTIYVVPFTIFSAHINLNATCGIPLTNWLLVLLIIVLVSNLQKLFMYIVV